MRDSERQRETDAEQRQRERHRGRQTGIETGRDKEGVREREAL